VGFDLSKLEFYSAAVLLRTAPKPLIDETLAMTELDLLKKPEYMHVVLNHLPIYGTILGALALTISLILRSRGAQITALILTLFAGASAYPVFVTGQRAYKTIRGLSDDPGADWLDEHMDRAEMTIGVFYFLAALAVAGLLVPIKWPKSAVPISGPDSGRSYSLFRNRGLYRPARRSNQTSRISAE